MSSSAPLVTPFEGEGTDLVVLRAAMARFSAYGYKRTSMEDIASEAKVSRPTLYSYFKNKQAILRAVSEGIHTSVMANVELALDADEPLESRLFNAFWAWSEPFVGILFDSRHGAELIGANSAIAADLSADAKDEFHRLVVKTLTKAKKKGEIDLADLEVTLADVADFLIFSLNGLSAGDTDIDTYKQRIQTLVRVFLLASRSS